MAEIFRNNEDIADNDKGNFGNIQPKTCSLTTSWAEFEMDGAVYGIIIDNQGAGHKNVHMKFASADTSFITILIGETYDRLKDRFRGSSIWLKCASSSFDITIWQYLKGTQQ